MKCSKIRHWLAFLLSASATVSASAQVYNMGAVYNNGPMYQNADLVNDSTALWVNAGSVSLTGNLVNNEASMDPSTGLLTFLGSSAQMVSGARPYMSYNAVFNNTSGVTLNQVLQVNNTGTFTAGVVTATTAGMPLVFGPSGVPAGASDASHVKGVVRTLHTSGTFTYPVGNGVIYRKIDATGIAGNTQGLDAQYFNADAGSNPFTPNGGKDATSLVQYFPKEYWNMKPVANDVTAGVTIYYGGAVATPALGNQSDLRVAHKTDNAWWNEGNTAVSGSITAGSVTSQPLDPAQWNLMTTDAGTPANVGWMPLSLGSINVVTPLPLKLLSFDGVRTADNDDLNWVTTDEQDTRYFEVEYSSDAKGYTSIGSVNASVESGSKKHYSFTHYGVSGDAFYRLRMVDVNGSATFSPVVHLTGSSDANADIMLDAVYPVPFGDVLNLRITSSKDQLAAMVLYSNSGSEVARFSEQLTKGSHVYTLENLSGRLAQGAYVLHVETKDYVITKKVIKE